MRSTKINWRDCLTSKDEVLRYDLNAGESQVYVWCRGTGEFSVTLDFLNEDTGEVCTIPVAFGSSVDGLYNFDGAVAVEIRPVKKGMSLAAVVKQTMYSSREVVDPVPKRLILPGNTETFEQRLLRGMTNLLDSRGIGATAPRGRDYGSDDDDDMEIDPQFGRGYMVDAALEADLDRELDARARAAAARRVRQSSDGSGNSAGDEQQGVEPQAVESYEEQRSNSDRQRRKELERQISQLARELGSLERDRERKPSPENP